MALHDFIERKKTKEDFIEFVKKVRDDKIDIQIRTDNISYWASRLKGKWESTGPKFRPWGYYNYILEPPDGLQIIIYQEKN